MVPIMTELMGMAKNDARTLSMLIMCVYAAVGHSRSYWDPYCLLTAAVARRLPPASAGAVVEYQQHGHIDWWMSGVLFLLYFGEATVVPFSLPLAR
eukprot:SAG22_NODE_8984_length_616_cov_1.425532_2_plen_95_part_01